MKLYLFFIWSLFLVLFLNIYNYSYFLKLLSILWYIASVLIIYLSFKLNIKYGFIQLNIKKIIKALRSKSKNDVSPRESLWVSLAAKIGVGSLSGVALAIYVGGVGTIFWMVIISLFVAVNTFFECILGITYREKINGNYVGGPNYYIRKCLGNKSLGLLYSILIIITYSGLFLSIQANTIVSITNYFRINNNLVVIILLVIVFMTIINGIRGVIKVNKIIVPLMIIFYVGLGLYVLVVNFNVIPTLIIKIISNAFNLKTIVSVFLIGMQRAIFVSESSLGTCAITSSVCDNNPVSQGLIEVMGIYITIFLVCLTTFLIVVTSNYNLMEFNNLNGIEILLHAFNYHFGLFGGIILAIIAIMFAFSTIISSYFFGESNIMILFKNKYI